MDFDLSWRIVTSDGLYWGIARSFVLIELGDSDSYGLCWDVSIFSTRSRDWLICWLRYTTLHRGIARMESMFHWSIVTLSDPLHWGISIFWREVRLIIYIGASTEWYRYHWIVSCCPHCILGHSHLVGCFDIETWLSILWLLFFIDYGAIDTSGLVSRHTWMILDTYLPFIPYSDISPWILSYLLSYQSLIITFLLSYTSHYSTWLHLSLD